MYTPAGRRRRKSWLQEFTFPEIHRLVNGVAIWQEPLGKRFSVYTATKMIAKKTKHRSWKALRRWLLQVVEQAHAAGAARNLQGEKKPPHKRH